MIDAFWMQGMLAGHKNTLDCIKAFSETDFTKDLEKFDVPTLILHGDDDQIVPIGAAAQASAKIVKHAVLKVYPGAPHGLTDTHKDAAQRRSARVCQGAGARDGVRPLQDGPVRADERLEREFPLIKLPVLILHGTTDKVTKPGGSQLFFDRLPSRLPAVAMLRNAGFHWRLAPARTTPFAHASLEPIPDVQTLTEPERKPERKKEIVMAQANTSNNPKHVVLVHGGFVDGSGWQGTYRALRDAGYSVSIVQNPTTSLADDVTATRRVVAAQNGPVILVGHSYGGVVVTEAGNDPRVVGLVYVAAFAPAEGESVASLIKDPPPGAPVPPILPPQDGYLLLDRSKFHASFAADLSADAAAFMADSQVPWGLDALTGAVTAPAWKTRPSWYLVATEDKMIPPDAQRAMARRAGSTVVEVAGSHSVYVSQPQAVASIIVSAAAGVALGPLQAI